MPDVLFGQSTTAWHLHVAIVTNFARMNVPPVATAVTREGCDFGIVTTTICGVAADPILHTKRCGDTLANLTSPCHERKALIYGLSAVMHLLHSTRCPSRRLGKEFQHPQFTKNGVEVLGNAGDLDFQAFTVHLQAPQPDGL